MNWENLKNGLFTQTEEEIDVLLEDVDERNLILHNDDVNTFDWVIDSIVKICKHSVTQAEQLTLMVHFKGKAHIKKGTFNELKPLKDRFIDRGINATID
ncbi:ATP-dependent Clp protease adaptor ClpS [bacterium]|nr:ATP-dependent Clp protease adaptor ClpS [bacterium]